MNAGFSPDLIDSVVAGGAKGLVIVSLGNRNMTGAATKAVARAVEIAWSPPHSRREMRHDLS